MRVDVKKFLFIGDQSEEENFFQAAQEAGLVHFINTSATASKEIPEEIRQVANAIKVLRGLPTVDQEENTSYLYADTLIQRILSLHQKTEELQEELRVLRLEQARVEIFGDFNVEDLHEIEKQAHKKIQFFCAKPSVFEDQPLPDELIYVGSDAGLDYYMAINDQPTTYERMIEIQIERPLGVLKTRTREARAELYAIEQELKSYAKYNEFLHQILVAKLNQYDLYTVQGYTQYAMDDKIFAIEGWVAKNKVDELSRFIEPMSIHFEEIAIEPTDVIPTYLENTGVSRLGEDLVHIYDTPSANDKDPSWWVLVFFTLFFAMIIGDAGYGLIYLVVALGLRYKYPHLKGTGKRILNLFTILSVGCIVWGTLMTSFFGMQLDPDNPLRKISLLQWMVEKKASYLIHHPHSPGYQEWIKEYPQLAEIKDPAQFVRFEVPGHPEKGTFIQSSLSDNVMFELALFIGMLHLIVSLLRYAPRNWHNIGWIAFIIGAYLYVPAHLNVPSFLNYIGGINLIEGGKIGFQLMIGGIAFAWVGSIVNNGWSGIFEIMNLIQVVADTLSYLRLYALGLAGAIVAATINDMVARVPLLAGIFLLLFSHLVNIALSTMGGVIHGLRLNFLEWYHYSFEGGGKQFRPLKLLKRE